MKFKDLIENRKFIIICTIAFFLCLVSFILSFGDNRYADGSLSFIEMYFFEKVLYGVTSFILLINVLAAGSHAAYHRSNPLKVLLVLMYPVSFFYALSIFSKSREN